MSVPATTDLRATLVTVIVGASETTVDRWEKRVGKVEYLSLAYHPRSNWRVEASGSEDDRHVVGAAIALLRGAEPYITRERNPGP